MKTILIVLTTGLLMLLTGMGISNLAGTMSPSINVEYQNPALFRPWSDPLMSLYWLVPFISAFILYRLWNKVKTLVNGENFVRRGLSFAFNYWVVTIPGMIMSYSSFHLSMGMVIGWTVAGLFQALVAGVILARFKP